MNSPAPILDRSAADLDLPAHLRPFVAAQDYGRYTPRDQAAWRFTLRQLTRQLAGSAHPVYLEGLAGTGIATDHIPSIDEMNACLEPLGWRAVVVDGFIPPAIFMEFQALRVLPIALAMRGVDQIFYTPAPDIVHESAGHAPFIVDVDYAEYLQRFGEVGMKAIASRADLALYEAVRRLSVLKEEPGNPADAIAAAEAELQRLAEADIEPSEASLLSRLHWWTVEYGLVGELDDYRIFGAGLLSSLGESRHCLDDSRVKKLPLTVDAVTCPYDITREQPQLFVTRSCKHMGQVLEEFAAGMCFTRGGAESLRKAIAADTVCTAQYDTGLQVSGVMAEVLYDAVGNATWFSTRGPTQLAWRDREIYGHGVDTHPEGFGSPVGHLIDFSRCLSQYTIDELKAHDIRVGEPARLDYLSGITVRGVLRRIHRQEHRNLLLSFDECTVTDRHGRRLFEPCRGSFHLAVGSAVTSVYGGAADRERLRLYEPAPQDRGRAETPAADLMALYTEVDALRLRGPALTPQLMDALAAWPDEWLLRMELLELATDAERAALQRELKAIAKRRPGLRACIELGLETAPKQCARTTPAQRGKR